MKWKNADIQFVKSIVKPDPDSDYEYEDITEKIPEIVAKQLKFGSDIKDEDLEYHNEDPEYDGRYPNSQLNQGDLEDLQKYYDEINIILPKGTQTR